MDLRDENFFINLNLSIRNREKGKTNLNKLAGKETVEKVAIDEYVKQNKKYQKFLKF
jgi:predicted metallo-beta-lactamase superfamily hydrolase